MFLNLASGSINILNWISMATCSRARVMIETQKTRYECFRVRAKAASTSSPRAGLFTKAKSTEKKVSLFFEIEFQWIVSTCRLKLNVTATVMEDKLESYRLRKRRTEAVQSIKEKFFGMITSAAQYLDTKVDIDVSELVVMEIFLKSVFVI
jgi:hypothetical protein